MEMVRLPPLKTKGYQDKNHMRPTGSLSSYAQPSLEGESKQYEIVAMMAEVQMRSKGLAVSETLCCVEELKHMRDDFP